MLDQWVERADRLERRTAQVLATSLASPQRALLTTVQSIEEATSPTDLLAAARALLDRPFVERVSEGYRIVEPVAALLRQQFRAEDGEKFAAVNADLIASERENLTSVDEEERWFARGRIAFYLAASNPSDSAREFIQTFSEPLPGDTGPQRLWLTDLALRQEALLAGETRALAFFKGFREYKTGEFVSARRTLARVISTDDQDQYRAIALHLWGVLADRHPRSESSLREAVELSERLGLVENEIMARNTLVFRLLARGARGNAIGALREAGSLAATNLELAERTGDKYLTVGARYGMVQSQWLNSSASGTTARDVPEWLVTYLTQNLDRATSEAKAIGDSETAAGAINLAASMARDRGLFTDAVDVLVTAFNDWKQYSPPRAARRWAQTAGSMLQADLTPEERGEVSALLTTLNAWFEQGPRED